MDEHYWAQVNLCTESLMLWRSVLTFPAGAAFRRLIASLAAGDRRTALTSYADLNSALADETLSSDQGKPLVARDSWKSHLLGRVLADENPFTRIVADPAVDEIPAGLLQLAVADLLCLESIFRIDAQAVCRAIEELHGDPYSTVPAHLPTWHELAPTSDTDPAPIGKLLDTTIGWSSTKIINAIVEHITREGSGLFGQHYAFRWVHGEGDVRSRLCLKLNSGVIFAIPHPDPICFDDLVGYEPQQELLLQNTEQFLAGAPANNVLLYGDRGTGKSASIKALLNEFGDRGLRLIEMAKTDLVDLPHLLADLRPRRERFIIFVDDLSFETYETHYKDLKVLLEGSLETRPANVVLYVTSNRRHLITERFSDRGSPDAMVTAGGPGLFNNDAAEIHVQDTLEEKLSLSDRFGLTLTYATPIQAEFLEIVDVLAERAKLKLAKEKLHERALAWAMQHNGRSGRTARQVVDFLAGEALLSGRTPGS